MPNLFHSPLAIVDVETTGMSYKNGGVIDVGILRIEQGQVVQTMRQLINPGTSLPAFITQLTGISNDDITGAPTFTEVAQDVYDLLEGCIFVAHNARFDYAFIKEELGRAGYQFKPRLLCTVKLSRALYPHYRSHKLDALIERFAIPILERHRAFADAEATWKALQCMVEQHDEAIINQQVRLQLRQPSLPVHLPQRIVNDLPESPGVYIFRSATNAPLYVGKSVSIRDRVLSHFSDDHRSPKEQRIAREITDIETISTTGELGALLTESRLIKELMPIHNRLLRCQTEMMVAIKGKDEAGYPTISLQRKSEILNPKIETNQKSEKINIENVILAFGSEAQDRREPKAIESRSYQSQDFFRDDDKLKSKSPSNLPPSTSCVPLDAVMAVYRSERQAKESLVALAKEHHLCHKLLGLQKTSGACFPHQLKVCYGACVGKESSLEYLMRFNQAFATTRIKQWPYATPIIITESDHQGQSDGYIIDNWCLVGHIIQHDQLIEHQSIIPQFDLDQYKILKRYISSPSNRSNIKPYSPQLTNTAPLSFPT